MMEHLDYIEAGLAQPILPYVIPVNGYFQA